MIWVLWDALYDVDKLMNNKGAKKHLTILSVKFCNVYYFKYSLPELPSFLKPKQTNIVHMINILIFEDSVFLLFN